MIDEEWKQFLLGLDNPTLLFPKSDSFIKEEVIPLKYEDIPKRNECEDLYISTQTQIFFLNQTELNVPEIFWKIPIIPYGSPQNGVIKKQMRVVSKDKEEFQTYEKHIQSLPYFHEKIMKQIDNPNARKIKFKDVRKITIGISKKDIMNCHGKNKSAFINCFAMILRVQNKQKRFHEIHVKVFNTGKMAIPGIVDDELLENTKTLLIQILQPNFPHPLKMITAQESPLVKRLVKANSRKLPMDVKKKKSYFEYVTPKCNVLINSNFNCGYFIQQEKLKILLRDKYHLNPTFDPSMYPGVKCKYYYNHTLPDEEQTGRLSESDQNATMMELDSLTYEKYTKVSFMIFRTGNCLIVGNCTKPILLFVFEFVKGLLMQEYDEIKAVHDIPVAKMKKNKPRKKIVYYTPTMYQNLFQNP